MIHLDKQDRISEPVAERMLAALADAYQRVKPECRGDFWQAILAICEITASGEFNGRMVLSVDFSLRMSGTVMGVKVEPLRFENMRPHLRLQYADLTEGQANGWIKEDDVG